MTFQRKRRGQRLEDLDPSSNSEGEVGVLGRLADDVVEEKMKILLDGHWFAAAHLILTRFAMRVEASLRYKKGESASQ